MEIQKLQITVQGLYKVLPSFSFLRIQSGAYFLETFLNLEMLKLRLYPDVNNQNWLEKEQEIVPTCFLQSWTSGVKFWMSDSVE